MLLLTYCHLLIMEFRFDAIFCYILGNKNSDAAHIKCSLGPHFARRLSTPGLRDV